MELQGAMPVAQSTWEGHAALVRQLAEKLKVKLHGMRPDIILGLEASGAYGAALLKTLLGASHMVVLDVVRDDDDQGGVEYTLGGLAQLDAQLFQGMTVICYDDSGRRFSLMQQLVGAVLAVGGTAVPSVIIRIGNEPLPFGLDDLTYLLQQDHSPNWPWKKIEAL